MAKRSLPLFRWAMCPHHGGIWHRKQVEVERAWKWKWGKARQMKVKDWMGIRIPLQMQTYSDDSTQVCFLIVCFLGFFPPSLFLWLHLRQMEVPGSSDWILATAVTYVGSFNPMHWPRDLTRTSGISTAAWPAAVTVCHMGTPLVVFS